MKPLDKKRTEEPLVRGIWPGATAMKVQDFAYNVAIKTMDLLEREKHYKIPEDVRKSVAAEILADLNNLIKAS